MESDPGYIANLFLSTPSARRATCAPHRRDNRAQISIHALREEGDPGPRQGPRSSPNFYPRPPRGGRPDVPAVCPSIFTISIHALREEGDTPPESEGTMQAISIHALREEGDYSADPSSTDSSNFYPRPPRGGRRITVPSTPP